MDYTSARKEETRTPTEIPVFGWRGTAEDRSFWWLSPMAHTCNLLQGVSLGDHSHLAWRCLRVTSLPRASDQLLSVLHEAGGLQWAGRQVQISGLVTTGWMVEGVTDTEWRRFGRGRSRRWVFPSHFLNIELVSPSSLLCRLLSPSIIRNNKFKAHK